MFQGAVFSITACVFFCRELDMELWVLGIMTAACAAAGLLMLVLVHTGMCIAEGGCAAAERERLFGRWTKHTLFAGMITMALTAFWIRGTEAWVNGDFGFRTVYAIGGAFISCIIAVLLYVSVCRRESRKRKRVKELAEEAVLNGGRRYSMVIDCAYAGENGEYLYAGRVHGTIRTGDTVHVIIPGGNSHPAYVTGLVRGEKRTGQLKDESGGIFLKAEPEEAFPTYALITGIGEAPAVNGENHLESRDVLGYVQGYDDHVGENEYMAVLVYIISHSRYLVPVYTPGKEMPDPSRIPGEDAQTEYVTVSARMRPKDRVLPLYTDWDALGRWRDLTDSGCREAAVIMTSEEVTKLAAERYTGAVINPFGPKPFFLSASLLLKLQNRNREEDPEPRQTEG